MQRPQQTDTIMRPPIMMAYIWNKKTEFHRAGQQFSFQPLALSFWLLAISGQHFHLLTHAALKINSNDVD
jgi:hypothetical protein